MQGVVCAQSFELHELRHEDHDDQAVDKTEHDRMRRSPAITWKIPARTTVAKMYSTPCVFARETMTTAIAPVAPEIIPGRPPKIDVTSPIVNAAYKPVNGERPAISANATASGISASATVRPERI